MRFIKPKFTKMILKFSLSLGLLVFLLVNIFNFSSVEVKADQKQLQNSVTAVDTSARIKTGVNLSIAKGVLRSATPDRKVNAVITAYTSTPDQTDDSPFISANGKRVYDGMIAANWLPFGTKIKIPSLYGDKVFTVDDRMNSRYGYGRLDMWLDASKTEARKFGVKRVMIEVYYPDRILAKY